MSNTVIELCNTGDTLYRISINGITEFTVIEILHYPHCVYRTNDKRSFFNSAFGKSVFKSRTDAENEIKRRELIKHKKELLKKYELELNKELGITTQIVK